MWNHRWLSFLILTKVLLHNYYLDSPSSGMVNVSPAYLVCSSYRYNIQSIFTVVAVLEFCSVF